MTSATPYIMSWQALPREIRIAILEALLQSEGSSASFATVSREWQTIIEHHNFSRIKLTLGSRASLLADFGSMMHRNRALIRYIWFCVELEPYDCFECEPHSPDPDPGGLSYEDNTRIVKGFEALFSTLSTWEPRPCGETLQLDITVHSPSDSRHWHKYLTFEPDLPSEECAFPLMEQKSIPIQPEYDDRKHGWRAGGRIWLPHRDALEETFNEIMDTGPFENEAQDMEWWDGLPLVPAVTSVLLRQQTRRRWKPWALARLFSRFPNLQEIHYEPWREWTDYLQGITDRSFQGLFEALAFNQPQLQRLVVFENFAPDYMNYEDAKLDCSLSRTANPNVSNAVCSASLKLEQLSASFIVEASQFFDCTCKNTSWLWANLTSVALTTRLFVTGTSVTMIEKLLRQAATTALRMPKLENMEIWNGEKRSAMLFRYQHRRCHSQPGTQRPAAIIWKGTWTRAIISRLRPRVTDAWEAVAKQQNSWVLDIVEELLSESDAAKIKSHGDAIYYLNLSSSVVRPISLRQIRMEQIIRDRVPNYRDIDY
ncbi:hypothetical protein F5Y04DRAFT_202172 [Hypomontagnella monticulosa]|nr:hypothetical protein F5Y04DRAFT_202172 [Hypomontagnella monticulosa]